MANVLELNKSKFDELMKEEGLLLVDFAAVWCPPCKMMAPVLENYSKDEDLKDITIASVDVDQENALAGQFQVASIPTFILFKRKGDGTFEELQKWMGAQDPLTFKSTLQGYIND